MPNWADVLNELKTHATPFDAVRRKYLKNLHEITGRNVIAYYSGWLQMPTASPLLVAIDDNDKNGFMNAVHTFDRSKGLDLILHTPGGDVAATESIVDYLLTVFAKDVRAIVPQLAMSAGTMISCACKSIVMGKQSSLGPIDPQVGGMPAQGLIEEMEYVEKLARSNDQAAFAWQPIIARYPPTLIGQCRKAVEWSETLVGDWLKQNMFSDNPTKADELSKNVLKTLASHTKSKSHSRHFSLEACKSMGLKIEVLEDNPELQDAVLSIHHCFIHTFAGTGSTKIIENHLGKGFITHTVAPILDR